MLEGSLGGISRAYLRGLKGVAGVSVKTGGGLENLHLRGVVKRGS